MSIAHAIMVGRALTDLLMYATTSARNTLYDFMFVYAFQFVDVRRLLFYFTNQLHRPP